MKKLLYTIRQEFSFTPELEPDIGRRLFRLLCLTISFITLFLLIPSDYLEDLPPIMNIPLALLGCGSFVLYLAALRGRHYHKTLLLMLLANINAVWFFNGGIDGSVPYFFIPICMYPFIIFRGGKRWITLAGIIGNGCVLIYLSYHSPSLVTTFKSPISRIGDLMIGLSMSAFSCVMVFWVVLGSYLRERDRLQVMNTELEREIARRVRGEEEIRKLAGEHRLILDTIPVGIVYLRERKIVWANPAFGEMFGYTRQEFLGNEMARYYGDGADYLRVGIEGYKRLLGAEKYATEVKMKKKGGALFWCSISGRAVDMGNPADGSIWTLQDISERKQAENELAASEERYRVLVELSPDAIYIHKNGVLTFANAKGAKLLGVDRPEDIYDRGALEFVHPDNREAVRQSMTEALQAGKSRPPTEVALVGVNGSQALVEVAAAPLRYHEEIAIARDITERKRMQDELLKSQKLESLGLLAGGIAHDFNNILTGILGNLSLANIRIEPSHPVAKYLRASEQATIRASKLTRQLLTFARGGDPVKKRVDAAPLIGETVLFTLQGSNVRAVMDLEDNLWCIEADGGQIDQALSNILINAVQAMPDGGAVTVHAGNEIITPGNTLRLPPGHYIKIVIEDGGCGIPRENLGRIFDPYFTTKPDGSGLGLASVYSIIKRHSGAVEAASTEGTGSIITIYLPALPGALPEVEAKVNPRALSGSGRILIMDDEEIIREILSEILSYSGYDVESCTNGAEAVVLFRDALRHETPFDAVILDLTVPGGMGGRETAGRMKEIDPHAVLIVSSGYSNDPVLADYRRYGFSGAITKPFDAEELTGVLKDLIKKDPPLRTVK